jgi:Flp pilus assembly protein TadG
MSGMQTNVRRKGAEILEFTLVLLPLLVIILVLLDTAWAIFAKSSLQYAVRLATRRGVTITAPQLTSGQCLTDVVKSTVQQNSFGMLTGDTKLALIKVNYFKPPAADSTDPVTDVSGQLDGNTPGNIMQVSVQGYSLMPLVPRIFNWSDKPERNPLLITVYAADRIEPARNPPCIGTAP